MLGENHSLDKEFPQYQDTIDMLMQSNEVFAKESKHYNELDREIRKLELNDAPIADDEMHLLKHERAVLKDELYRFLVKAEN